MKRAIIAILLSLPMVGMAMSAQGHSWYPHECCSERDCVPVDSIDRDDTGHVIIWVGRRRIWIPFGLEPRPSPDGRVHICYRVLAGELDGSTFTMPVCWFRPAES